MQRVLSKGQTDKDEPWAYLMLNPRRETHVDSLVAATVSQSQD